LTGKDGVKVVAVYAVTEDKNFATTAPGTDVRLLLLVDRLQSAPDEFRGFVELARPYPIKDAK
jgi:hypothetical protein